MMIQRTLEEAINAKDADALKAYRPFPKLTLEQLWHICTIVHKNVWVGPDDEMTLESAWTAAGDLKDTLNDREWELWKTSEEYGAEVRNVPWLKELRTTFADKTRALALRNMERNTATIKAEGERLGLAIGGEAAPAPTEESDKLVAEQQKAAEQIMKAKEALRGLRTLRVGYHEPSYADPTTPTTSPPGGVDAEPRKPMTYDPITRPPLPPEQGDGMPSWDTVNGVHQDILKSISRIANSNPAVYALMATRPPDNDTGLGDTDILTKKDLTAVRTQLGASFQTLLENIAKTRAAIESRDLGFADLVPVHDRIYATDQHYTNRFGKAAAQDYVDDEGSSAAKANELIGAAAIALIAAVEIGTAGAASPVIGALIGLTASTAGAVSSWSQWSTLDTAAKSTVSDDTAVVTKEQADSALLSALIDSAAALLDVYGVGKAIKGGAAAAKVAALEARQQARTQLAKLRDLPAGERAAVVAKALDEQGAAAVVRQSGHSVDDLIAIVGKETPAGQRLARFAAAGEQAMSEEAVKELGPKLAAIGRMGKQEAGTLAVQAVELIGPARTLEAAGGWHALEQLVGADAAAMKHLNRWRDLIARETEQAAGTLDAAAARAVLAQRAGLGENVVETLLGVAIGVLGEGLDQDDEVLAGGHIATLDLDAPAPVQKSVQRVPGPGPASLLADPKLAGLTGTEFELIIEQALRRGSFRDHHDIPPMDWVIPGHYNGSGWGIDRIGIVEDGNRVKVFHIEVKYVRHGSDFVPALGATSHGTQTGLAWTENAVHQLLNADNTIAQASRAKLMKALGTTDKAVLARFLRSRVVPAEVLVITPFHAHLSHLWQQVGGLVRAGRRIRVVPVGRILKP
jgi:hypothetical protein